MDTITARLSSTAGYSPLWTREVHEFALVGLYLIGRCGVETPVYEIEVVADLDPRERCRVCSLGLADTRPDAA
jgi:hypothetical protein